VVAEDDHVSESESDDTLARVVAVRVEHPFAICAWST
jgi:hypothetical protein